MNILVWTQWPDSQKLKVLIVRFSKSRFQDVEQRQELLNECVQYFREVARFVRQAFFEASINIRYMLPVKVRRIKNLANAIKKQGDPDGRLKNPYKFLLEQLNIELNVVNVHDTVVSIDQSGIGGARLVIANHPYPPIDGVAVMSWTKDHLGDFWMVVNANNALLKIFPDEVGKVIELESSEGVLGKKDTERAVATRFVAFREIIRRLIAGETIVIFPAGAGSKATAWNKEITDPAWSPSIGLIIQRLNKLNIELCIYPLYFQGHMGNDNNSQIYQYAIIDKPSRLPQALQHALFNHPDRVTLHVGRIIKGSDLCGLDNAELVSELRRRVYEMQNVRIYAKKSGT